MARGVRRSGGAVAVEAAFVLPVLLLLVMGAIDFGLTINSQQQLVSGTRAAARHLSVGTLDSTSTCTLVGFPTGASTADRRAACTVKSRLRLPTDEARVRLVLPGTYAVGQPMRVCAQYPQESATGMYDPVINGHARSRIDVRIESLAASTLSAWQEAPHIGTDWTWCTQP
jgi:hypothetical protein